jgi:hypothetical protein
MCWPLGSHRRHFREGERIDVATLTLDVLRSRDVPWLADLTRRLAELRTILPLVLAVVTGLVEITGIDPPLTDGLVLAWAREHRGIAPAALDARWDALVLRVFDVDGAGRLLDFRAAPCCRWPVHGRRGSRTRPIRIRRRSPEGTVGGRVSP